MYSAGDMHDYTKAAFAAADDGDVHHYDTIPSYDDLNKANVSLGEGVYYNSYYFRGENGDSTREVNLSINAGTLPSFYGQVSAHSFSYSGTNPNPTPLPDPVEFDSAPYVPPTSRMDYQNVVPDSNLDGIVQADHDQSSSATTRVPFSSRCSSRCRRCSFR